MTKTEVDYLNQKIEYENLNENEKSYSNENKGPRATRKRVERPTTREEHHYHYYPNPKLYRSTRDKWLGGVCGGIAEHFNKSPNVIRLLWILMTIISVGFGVLAYIVLWLLVDKYPANYRLPSTYPEQYQSTSDRRSVHIHYE